jgi:hypothetical protein
MIWTLAFAPWCYISSWPLVWDKWQKYGSEPTTIVVFYFFSVQSANWLASTGWTAGCWCHEIVWKHQKMNNILDLVTQNLRTGFPNLRSSRTSFDAMKQKRWQGPPKSPLMSNRTLNMTDSSRERFLFFVVAGKHVGHHRWKNCNQEQTFRVRQAGRFS